MLLDDISIVLLAQLLQVAQQLDLSSFKKGTYYLKVISQYTTANLELQKRKIERT